MYRQIWISIQREGEQDKKGEKEGGEDRGKKILREGGRGECWRAKGVFVCKEKYAYIYRKRESKK